MNSHPYGAVVSAIGATFFGVVSERSAPSHHLELCASGLVRCCALLGDPALSHKLETFWKASGDQSPLPSLLKEPLGARFPPSNEDIAGWLLETFAETSNEEVSDGGDFFDKETLATLLEIFQEEAREIVLEQVKIHAHGTFSEADVAELFRYAHTLKGAAATVGLVELSRSALVLESYYRAHRDGHTCPSKHSHPLMDMATWQFIRSAEGNTEPAWNNESLLAFARACDIVPDPFSLFAPPPSSAPAAPVVPTAPAAQGESHGEFLVDEAPLLDDELTALLMEVFKTEAEEHLDALDRNLENLAQGKPVLQDLFRTTHTLKGAAGTVGLSWVREAAHRLEDYFETLVEKNAFPHPQSLQYLFQAASQLRARLGEKSGDLKVINDLVARAQALDAKVPEPNPSGPVPVAGEAAPGPVRTPAEAEIADALQGPRFTQVPSQQLEYLFNDAEELVLVRTQLEKSRDEFQSISSDLFLSHHTLRAFLLEDRNTMSEAERLERLQEVEVELAELINNLEHASSLLQKECKSLQSLSQRVHHNLVELRVTDLELIFLKVRQAIRDAAFMTQKEIEFTSDGEGVELDKGVIQLLSTPLLQIARNAVAHGAESPQARKLQNKSGPARIHLSARQEGRFILFELSDDGPGIDPGQIRSRLVNLGVLDAATAEKTQDDDILDAVFLPGFTTRETADNLSGRGVGLDLVRNQVRKIGGEVSVKSVSHKGCTFQIRVPLTTVISQAMIFRLGQEFYGIPVTYVIEIFEMVASRSIEPGTRILWKKESIPVVPLHYFFGIEQQIIFKKTIPIVILEHGGRHFGITVDSLIGIKDVTTKSINHILSSIQFFSGVLVSGAGTIQLMFDVPFLANLARPVFGLQMHAKRGSLYSTPRILVCDDSKSVREAASRVLTDAGYHTVIVSDGWEAWNALHNEEFDLLLTDLEMPRMNGYELVQEVKRDSLLQDIPIVVLSSRTGETSRDRVKEAGADCFVTKPIKPLVLLKAIREYLPLEEHLVIRKIIIFATHNSGKARELQALLSSLSIDVWGLDRFPELPDVVEDQDTFEKNAIKKALTRARQTGLPTLADDSGLMVDVLDGDPGVHSARYAGEEADDRARIALLLERMKGKTNRAARFVSAIAFCPNPSSDQVIVVRGEVEGTIGVTPRGEHGFGYDPVFVLAGGRTMAEISLEEKSEISHRARAFENILPHLKRFVNQEK
ncbi:RdgB/HAM1 family non-canonical purine NTP pyrophosphatase [Myxococcota bacterium]|nr:RdgB/HAM1 family non-canonical purine NTP pyrophosphatase [Myxococcota bacterium]